MKAYEKLSKAVEQTYQFVDVLSKVWNKKKLAGSRDKKMVFKGEDRPGEADSKKYEWLVSYDWNDPKKALEIEGPESPVISLGVSIINAESLDTLKNYVNFSGENNPLVGLSNILSHLINEKKLEITSSSYLKRRKIKLKVTKAEELSDDLLYLEAFAVGDSRLKKSPGQEEYAKVVVNVLKNPNKVKTSDDKAVRQALVDLGILSYSKKKNRYSAKSKDEKGLDKALNEAQKSGLDSLSTLTLALGYIKSNYDGPDFFGEPAEGVVKSTEVESVKKVVVPIATPVTDENPPLPTYSLPEDTAELNNIVHCPEGAKKEVYVKTLEKFGVLDKKHQPTFKNGEELQGILKGKKRTLKIHPKIDTALNNLADKYDELNSIETSEVEELTTVDTTPKTPESTKPEEPSPIKVKYNNDELEVPSTLDLKKVLEAYKMQGVDFEKLAQDDPKKIPEITEFLLKTHYSTVIDEKLIDYAHIADFAPDYIEAVNKTFKLPEKEVPFSSPVTDVEDETPKEKTASPTGAYTPQLAQPPEQPPETTEDEGAEQEETQTPGKGESGAGDKKTENMGGFLDEITKKHKDGTKQEK
jgi:hypothetical protein